MSSEQVENRGPNGRFRPGASGNPGGRPKGASLGALLREALDADDGTGKTRAERLAETLVTAAIGGDVRAIALVFDRVDGRAPMMAEGGEPEDDVKTLREHLDPGRFRVP